MQRVVFSDACFLLGCGHTLGVAGAHGSENQSYQISDSTLRLHVDCWKMWYFPGCFSFRKWKVQIHKSAPITLLWMLAVCCRNGLTLHHFWGLWYLIFVHQKNDSFITPTFLHPMHCWSELTSEWLWSKIYCPERNSEIYPRKPPRN